MATGFEPETQPVSTEFAKELGLTEAISIAVGAMIGGGIFSALGRLASITGPSAVFSFILGGIIAALTSNSYVRLVAKYPSAGGEFVILRRGFKNPLIGNSIGMMLWLGYSITIALYAFTFGNYVSEFIYTSTGIHFFDINYKTFLFNGRELFSFLSIVTFAYVNLRGVKESGTIQNVIVLFKISVLMMVGALGFAVLFKDPSLKANFIPFSSTEDSFIKSLGVFSGFGGMLIGASVIFVSYEGFQVIANTVEELKNPARDVRLGMYISVFVVTLTYALTTIATFILISDRSTISETALLVAVERFGPFIVLLVTLGAAASTTSAINATILGSSRLAYVMSDWAAFPKRLAVISKKNQVPYLAIITTSFLSWIFTLFGKISIIAEVGSIIFLGIFLSINLSVLQIFPKERNLIAKTGAALIVLFMILVIVFFATHPADSGPALVILIAFSVITVVWMFINQTINKDVEVDKSKYELEPLGIELIQEFSQRKALGVDDFFINLENILVPASGKKFEKQNWITSALLGYQFNAKVTLLHVGSNEKRLKPIKEIYDRYKVNYEVVVVESSNISDAIVETYHKGEYDLICLSSDRRDHWVDRMLDKSVSKNVVSKVDCGVLQTHPQSYGTAKEGGLSKVFLMFDGTERDSYLARYAKLMTAHSDNVKIYAYHMILLPNTLSPEEAYRAPQIQNSAKNFETYANEVLQEMGFTNIQPTLLYGHSFTKALVEQTKKYAPDAIFIGHTKDKGLFKRMKTPLSYQILNKVQASVVVTHMANKME